MSNNDLIDSLARVPLFADCDRKELAQIAQLTTAITIEAGTTFIKEGSYAREMMIIESGSATVSKGGDVVAEIGPGAVVGELALLTGHARNATVTSSARSELLVLGASEFASLLDAAPSVTRKILVTVAKRLSTVEEPD